jgi:hypothetical protein
MTGGHEPEEQINAYYEVKAVALNLTRIRIISDHCCPV